MKKRGRRRQESSLWSEGIPLLPEPGGPLKRLHRPNRFRAWLRELEGGGVDLHVDGLDPVTLNAGLMKPRRGFTLVAGEENWGVGELYFALDKEH